MTRNTESHKQTADAPGSSKPVPPEDKQPEQNQPEDHLEDHLKDHTESADTSAISRRAMTRRQFALRGLALTGIVAAADIEYQTQALTVTRHSLRMPGLRAPCRVVQISDLHRSWCVPESFVDRVVARANSLAPDIVALTGDFVTFQSDYMESCGRALHNLRAPLGLFAVLGNHDNASDDWHGGPAVAHHLTGMGVQMLTNRSEHLDNGLRLVGVDDFRTGAFDPDRAFRDVRQGESVLAMTHNPFAFAAMCRYDCVTIAGHTHGGQIIVPGLTTHFIGARMRYQHGWYQEPRQPGRMYVTRGVGVVGLPFRYHCPPEIAVFDLFPA